MNGNVFMPRVGVRAGHRRGFALVVVLIILTLLAVVAVGFLSSMTAERTTSVAYANKSKADQAAQAGADSAIATLRQCFKNFPDSCTVWDPQQSTNEVVQGQSVTYNPGTSLFYRGAATPSTDPLKPDDNRPPMLTPSTASTAAPDKRVVYVLPLTSGVINGTAVLEINKANALPTLNTNTTDPTAQNFVDLNAKRSPTDTEGWIGSSPYRADKTKPDPLRVPWVEVKDSKGAVNSRYAFWVEDESFRANINYADLGDSANPHKRRDNLQNPPQTDTLGYIGSRDVDLLGPLTVLADTSANDDAQGIIDARNFYPTALFPEGKAFAHATNMPSSIAERLRFLTTTTSGGLNLSRHGSQRLNLNAAIPSDTSPTDLGAIKGQLETIVGTLRFHTPDFGQRLYRKNSASTPAALNALDVIGDNVAKDSSDHSLIYLYKTAANIRDYIDKDAAPTVVLAGGIVAPATRPTIAFDSPPWAIGKDSAPFIQECAVRYAGDITGSGPSGKYVLTADYYVEVWNMSAQDVKASDIGPHLFVRIANPPKFVGALSTDYPNSETDLKADDGVSPSDTRPAVLPAPRDFDMDLAQVTYSDGHVGELIFPAGAVTVLTTDTIANHAGKSFTDVIKDTEALKHVVQCKWINPGKSTYSGPMPIIQSGANQGKYCNVITMLFSKGADNTQGSDYETNILMGTDNGWVDGLEGALPISWGGRINFKYTGSGNVPVVYGGYPRGNFTNLTTNETTDGFQQSMVGDPRATNEQLLYNPPEGYGLSETTRFKVFDVPEKKNPTPTHPYTGTTKGVIPTLGLPNYLSVHPNRTRNPWIDYPPLFTKTPDVSTYDLVVGQDKAPAVVNNAPLSSIGQLGDVYDAARIIYSGGDVTSSHGGGRTFKIGQHDDRWDGDQTSASRGWASWRLLDFFSIADHKSQPRLVDVYSIEQPGVINVNGVVRDKGAAIRAALVGLEFQKANKGLGDRYLDGSATSTNPAPALNVDALIDQISRRVTSPLTNSGLTSTGDSQTGAGPFWERGELSELRIFGRTPTPSQSPGSTPSTFYATTDLTTANPAIDLSSQVFDRGREEVFRRLSEMITTRGNVFTVYALGQSVFQNGPAAPKMYSASQRLKITFKLVPKTSPDPKTGIPAVFHPGTDEDGKPILFGNSITDDALRSRFAKPDHYDIVVLSSITGT